MELSEEIKAAILKDGDMPFHQFMQHALYHPHQGYYTSGLQKFGPKGDFITAPELSPLFGMTVANALIPLIQQEKLSYILEFGAGSGQLCIDVLTQLEQQQALPEKYFILEVSGELQHRQKASLIKKIPHLAEKVQWCTELPKDLSGVIVLANEVLDAMPVHRFKKSKSMLLESFISINEHNELIECFKPSSDQRLIDYLTHAFPEDCENYLSEANLWLSGWFQALFHTLNRGAVFLIDYGFPRHEYYHPDRHMGTLMCHAQHHAHPHPLTHIGEQDITAHVDFTHVAESASEAGFHVAGFCNQASFLLTHGLLSFIESIHDEKEKLRATKAIKILTQPSEMGELFKVMALTKNVQLPDFYFLLQDKRASL